MEGLPQIVELVEKGGIIGLLLVFTSALIWDRMRLIKELKRAYRQRDKARITCERFRAACASANMRVDVADIEMMFVDDDQP